MSYLPDYFTTIPLNNTEIPQSKLNIEQKTRSNPLKWNGQFSPQLIEILLKTYSGKGYKILDPFLGSGTVLLEAGIQGFAAKGTEVNPGAFILSSTYRYMNIPLALRRKYLNTVAAWLDENSSLPLFSTTGIQHAEAIETLMQSHLAAQDDWERILVQTLIVLLDLDKKALDQHVIFETWKKVSQHILKLPYSEECVEAYHADARNTQIEPAWADLVITSPPYINVFNYHQQYRRSLEFLDYNLLEIAKSEIGSNRKHRSNRFLTVIQYCLDMTLVFRELQRVTQPDARIIFIVGRESSVRGVSFYNGQIVTEIAHHAIGYDLELKQERCFRNRFGQNIYEDILHFRLSQKHQTRNDCLGTAKAIAQRALENAYAAADQAVQRDISYAIEQVHKVSPSPALITNTVMAR